MDNFTFKIFPGSPKQAGKKERGLGERPRRSRQGRPYGVKIFAYLLFYEAGPRFLPAPLGGAGSQKSASGFSRKKVRILTKRDSTILYSRFSASFCASPLRGSALKWGKFPRHFFALWAKKI
ncbi:MAG: hypothetical protein COX34_02390 [Candidatus Nealsonbacteria bacterium CG23_combo_of_CG06-09_8_20_14_all_36_12]|uniref:Uncharacterized protein n=2 Tax=Candidatus Nealsoniibacteriota TaxID=1817911 RepID=A0A2H0TLT3_9BACT|nr:MAG: hypothetical protein COX34_02390 [Candidatus Nealsonbacteria bacterium CG23_combo_of_CG06-09_8_20_14_all_36_12]PIR73103.1 MAG: hypothetical protein COV26_00240 [Candidatus Nealsonbacteria bacterium CG10_big_fil_rev_8_21_14_0_10_36_23]